MMKTLIFLLGLIATLHSGYGQSKKELLCRKWGMDLSYVTQSSKWKNMSDARKNELLPKIKETYYLFRTDGTCAFHNPFDSLTLRGTWKFIKDRKAISLQLGEKEELTLYIVELTEDVLKMEDELVGNDKERARPLVPFEN